ncbi:MAG TPA: hypothetical protein VLJ20_12770 [Acetobacteraceae bacterium]|nr:hypothetical protein [Acetobacteraceae bacterium]
MIERTDTPPLLTALELDRLRARLEAQDARIEELHGQLRPLRAKLHRMQRMAPGMSRLGTIILAAPAVAVTALAVIVGILNWQQDRRIAPAAAPVAAEAPSQAPTAQSQPSRFMLPPLRPPTSRG